MRHSTVVKDYPLFVLTASSLTLEKVFRRNRMETVNALTHKPPEDQFFRGLVH